jgi:hypothetical protein
MRSFVGRRRVAAVLLGGSLLLVACSPAAHPLTQPSWPAPANPMELAVQAGLEPTDREYLTTHTHSHLHVFVDGKEVVVPAGIGIDIEAPTGIDKQPTLDKTSTEYYVTRCAAPCLSPLHTHDAAGIIHTESKTADQDPYTLGQFFSEWGVRLDESCIGEFCKADTTVAIYLDGKKEMGNPADIKLASHLEIAIVIGTAPEFIPDTWDFGDEP